MNLQISDSERTVLLEVLRRALEDLREEIYKTDTTDYKAELREREAVLNQLLDRLTALRAEPLRE